MTLSPIMTSTLSPIMTSTLSPCEALKTHINDPPKTEKDTGKSACEEIERIRKDAEVKIAALKAVQSMVNGITDIFNPFTAVAQLICGKLGNTNQQTNELINNVETVINNMSRTQSSNICNNLTDSTQTNILSRTHECAKVLNEPMLLMCGPMTDYTQKMACIKEFSDINTVKDITQSNTNNQKNDCNIINIISELSKTSSDIQTLALIKVIQDAKGMGNINTANTYSCNNIKTTINSTTYLNALNCCNQQNNNQQTNIMMACGKFISNSQTNNNTQENSCLLNNSITKDTSINVTTTTTLAADGANNGNNTGSVNVLFIVIMIIAVGIILGIVYGAYKYLNNTPMGRASKFIR